MSNRIKPEFANVANKENRLCYVCGEYIPEDIPNQYFCHRYYDFKNDFSNEPMKNPIIQYRHLWHGVAGIRNAVGGGGGFNGYALTLEEAKQRAEYYTKNNPYAAPKVQSSELDVLWAVQWQENYKKPHYY